MIRLGSGTKLPESVAPSRMYNRGDEIQVVKDYDSDWEEDLESEDTSTTTTINTTKETEILDNAGMEEVQALIKRCQIAIYTVESSEKKIAAIDHKRTKQMLTLIEDPIRILKQQFEMVVEIIALQDENPDSTANIRTKYLRLKSKAITFEAKKDLCYSMLAHCLALGLKMLKEMNAILEEFLKEPKKRYLGEVQIVVSKMETFVHVLPYAAVFDKTDLFTRKASDPYWSELKGYVTIKQIAPTKAIKRQYERFFKGLSTGVSLVSRGSSTKNFVIRNSSAGIGAIVDTFATSQAQRRADLFYSNPNQQTAFQIWNMLDQGAFLKLFKLTFPTVKHSRKVYISRYYDIITFENIQDAIKEKTISTPAPLKLTKNSIFSDENTIKPSLTYKDLRRKTPESIPLRILCAEPLPGSKTGLFHTLANKLSCCTDTRPREGGQLNHADTINSNHPHIQPLIDGIQHLRGKKVAIENIDPYFDGLILHIHGGGFVSMSSFSHQAYTRRWAQKVGKSVLSVDYRLAPQNPYPAALDDCWQAYNWILNDMEHSLGIKPSKIVLVGDSAGGNLALGITLMAIKCGTRIPSGLLLAYPALKLETRSYSPSLLFALDDKILPHSILKMIPGAYIPEGGKPLEDPFLSPIQASDELLKLLPPIRIQVGDKDPFHDECWRFVDKMRKLKKDIKMTVYQDLTHGYLGYAFPGGVHVAKKCVNDAAETLKELFSLS